MSEENLKVVQAATEAYFRGDERAMLELVDPDIVVTQLADQPDVRPYHGHDGMLQAMAEWIEAWDDWASEVLDMKDAGDNVLVSLRQRGRGKVSGIPMEGIVYFVFTVRAGRIVRWQMFPSEGEALQAAGLEENPAR